MGSHITNTLWKLWVIAVAGATALSSPKGGGAPDAWDAKVNVGHTSKTETFESTLPLVVNTWTGAFSSATERAWAVVCSEESSTAALDAVEQVR